MRAVLLLLSCLALARAAVHEGEAAEALVSWLKSKGSTISDKIAVKTVNGKRGVFALEEIPAGEKLFFIPLEATVTEGVATAYLHDNFRQMTRYEECANHFPALPMLAFLAIYRRSHLGVLPSTYVANANGAPFDFAPYFASLPQDCEMPVCTMVPGRSFRETTEDLRYISDLEEFSHAQFRNLHTSCLDAMHSVMEGSTDQGFDYSYVTRDDLDWAHYTADSRSWSSYQGCTPEQMEAGDLCDQLIPFADLFNHNTGWPEVNNDGYVTDRVIKAGEEVFDNYGDFKSPWEIYKQYGFHLDNFDQSNWYPFKAETHVEPSVPITAAKASLLAHLNFEQEDITRESLRTGEGINTRATSHKSKLMLGYEPSPRLFQFLRIVNANWAEFGTFLDTMGVPLATAGTIPLSDRNELVVHRILLRLMNDFKLQAWGSGHTAGSYEQDVALLAGGSLDAPELAYRKQVVLERSRHKRIVEDVLRTVANHLAALEARVKPAEEREL